MVDLDSTIIADSVTSSFLSGSTIVVVRSWIMINIWSMSVPNDLVVLIVLFKVAVEVV